MLQYMEKVLEVPRHFVGFAIGNNGKNIEEIIKKSGVFKINIKGDKKVEADSSKVEFVVTGIRESIEGVRLLLQYQLDSLDSDKSDPENNKISYKSNSIKI